MSVLTIRVLSGQILVTKKELLINGAGNVCE
jgi:hypothetical protein